MSSLSGQAPIPLIDFRHLLRYLTPKFRIRPGPTNDSDCQMTDIILIHTALRNSWTGVAKIYNRLWVHQQYFLTMYRTYAAATPRELEERWESPTQPESEESLRQQLKEVKGYLDRGFGMRVAGEEHEVNLWEAVMWNIAARAEQTGVVLVERAENEENSGE